MFSRILIFVCLLMMSASTFAQNLPPIEKGVSHELAKWRAANYSDVRYKLNLTIEKKAPTLKGKMEISLKSKSDRIFLDWRKIKGNEILSKVSNININGNDVTLKPESSSGVRPQLPVYEEYNEHLVFIDGVIIGENVIKLDFESPILTSGSAITRYIDKEDGAEYIYSLFVPSDASTAFPVFDQPDLKARFQLTVNKPKEWTVISNALGETSEVSYSDSSERDFITEFDETKPISSYVFAFATGDFTRFDIPSEPSKIGEAEKKEIYDKWLSKSISIMLSAEDSARFEKEKIEKLSKGFNSDSKDFSHIYVRKSQAEKFKPHAEEVFRLNRESIKYLEDYFDYKFPFPKYDLVLIPEFPFGGMEHAGATFLRESSIIFPTEPTANNYISRASLIFHENAHQWFGDTVTMKWFDDLWLKEGFATFMAYKTMEKVMPEYNAWKIFYERTKPLAYATDVTKGTTPIYQELPNLSAAKSAYGNIVYQKAPSFLRQAEFYLGEKEFQTAVRSFLKKHEFKNATWQNLVSEFEISTKQDLKNWANSWVTKRGMPIIRVTKRDLHEYSELGQPHDIAVIYSLKQEDILNENKTWQMKIKVYQQFENKENEIIETVLNDKESNPKIGFARYWTYIHSNPDFKPNIPQLIFPNYQDYGYGIFLLDERSKEYILENIQNEKDDFLRSMMWGSLWDSVRFAELAPKDYVELAIKNIGVEKDVSTISSILGRVETAYTYYLSDAQQKEIAPKLENLLIEKMKNAPTLEQRITFYRAFLNIAYSDKAKNLLKDFLKPKTKDQRPFVFKTKDQFDIVTRLIVLGDKDAPQILAELEKTETDDAAKRYAYAAKAGFANAENKAKYWKDFTENKEISESWIEEAMNVWNSPSHSELTVSYLEKALAELPNHKQNRKIFFVNGWTAAFIGGQKSEQALNIVNKFLKDNPKLDIDLQRKILERVDGLERAVKIREKYGK